MVRWDFVEEMLQGSGFPPHFRHLIMAFVTTTKFPIKVNGIVMVFFKEGEVETG